MRVAPKAPALSDPRSSSRVHGLSGLFRELETRFEGVRSAADATTTDAGAIEPDVPCGERSLQFARVFFIAPELRDTVQVARAGQYVVPTLRVTQQNQLLSGRAQGSVPQQVSQGIRQGIGSPHVGS